MIPGGIRPVVYASQFDEQTNAVTFTLYSGEKPFSLPSGVGILVNGRKPDGTVFSYSAASFSGNTVSVNVMQQMTAIQGDVLCELRLSVGAQEVGTANFILRVEEAPLNSDSVLSETELPLIEQAANIAATLAEQIETTTNAASTATDAADRASGSATQAALSEYNVNQQYSSLEQVKANANAAAASANAAAAGLASMSAEATTLASGESATVTYNNSTKKFTFGIPQGPKGESGVTVPVDGFVTFFVGSDGYLYAASAKDVSDKFYYDETTGILYYKSKREVISNG